MRKEDLATILFDAAKGRADKHGVRFGDGANYHIHGDAERGAELILAREPQVTETDSIVVEAKSALERLVDLMVRAAAEIEGYSLRHPGVIGEETYARGKKGLCPCFPIC